ncbi:DUF421 domain-containing protein [Spirosoma linguale]|uniref:DUF421 domain-containing protein n=1 Tax=Spirosoma linguale (strain ATCC 33905 / DSM 74 / LMG 10896 / Claus 1) TaxID=504472 RepID=D2QKN1_SPILD|nr:protein of unknown function DUF421 [Spirosoma linguale DSM 74]
MTDVFDNVSNWLFKGWESIGRVLFVGVLAYAGLLLFLRISGKRTLSKMNAFDLVVTVALGSTLSTIIVSRQTGVADGLMALALLIGLQYSVAWLSVRWPWFRRGIKSEPALLFHQGTYLHGALRRERVTPDEILSAMRQSGAANPADVSAVVLETDGSFTVISGSLSADMPSLQNVTRPSQANRNQIK